MHLPAFVCMLAGLSVGKITQTIITERELMFMFAIFRRPSVCLSSVCNVPAPYTQPIVSASCNTMVT